VRIQREVAKRISLKDEWQELKTIAGLDIGYVQEGRGYASCVILDIDTLKVVEEKVKAVKIRFPYIPTFLAFRELEGILALAREADVDVYMVGAHGFSHPRRAGLASHLGVILDRPTVGVAKSKLCGEAEEPPNAKGEYTLLKEKDEIIGAVVRTRPGAKPVYVSVGHKLSLETAIAITLRTTTTYRLPQPLRLAHQLATRAT